MIKQIPVDQIKTFLDRESSKDSFNDLVRSVKKFGVLVPIAVSPIKVKKKIKQAKKSTEKEWLWELIWGHRRLRAAKLAGLKTIPAIVSPVGLKDKVKSFFIENETRRNLSSYEIAVLMDNDRENLTFDQISEKYSMSIQTVKQYLGILDNASPELRSLLHTSKLTLHDANPISKLDSRSQKVVINTFLQQNLDKSKIRPLIKSLIQADDQIDQKLVKAKTKGLVDLLKEKEIEYQEVLRKYNLSVLTLQSALSSEKVRNILSKRGVDYCYFYQE